jgi:hypothetical protein
VFALAPSLRHQQVWFLVQMAAQVDRGAALAGQAYRLMMGASGCAAVAAVHVFGSRPMNIVIVCLAALLAYYGWMTLEAKRHAITRATDALSQELEFRVVPLPEPPPKS